MGRRSQLQLSQEYSFRPEKRARLNAAAEIRLVNRETWESTVVAGIGGLLPDAGASGALDVGGSLSLYQVLPQTRGGDRALPHRIDPGYQLSTGGSI
jgi:hypothetical protein